MIFDAKNTFESVLASSTAWLPLVYDTVVFGLTFYRTYPNVRGQSRSKIAKRLLEDGLLYYSVIFSVTLVLTLMIIFAPDGLKNVAAQLELLITVTMMSRITLNLKKFSRTEENYRYGTSGATMTWPASIASKMIPQFFKPNKKTDGRYDTFGFGGTTTTSTFGRWGVPDTGPTGTTVDNTDTMELTTLGNGKVHFDEEDDYDDRTKMNGDRDTPGAGFNTSRV
ncbi:hypothetical protein AAF712_013627 [Marasmius tenuissimus]|uniref:Uncharacterized protein n=1 Tax=Marasmius tenuissimus TaxID=585030 RepID=A0ABR2ZEC4_9AGAR